MESRINNSKKVRRQPNRRSNLVTRSQLDQILDRRLEHKYYDTSGNDAVDYNGVITILSSISQGDTDTTRDGDKICLKSVEFRQICANADTYNNIRTILFMWKPTTTPTMSDMLIGVGAITSPSSALNHDKQMSYVILFDSGPTPLSAAQVHTLTKVVKIPNVPLGFIAGGTTGQNHIYLLHVSDSASVAHPVSVWYSRINYTDA